MRVRRDGIKERYESNAAAAATLYEAQATDPGTDWATPTAAAEDIWRTAVIAAAEAGRFSTGVIAAGNAKYKARISASRYRTGIHDGADAYEAAMTPFLDALEAATLTPRSAEWEENLRRVEEVIRILKGVAGR